MFYFFWASLGSRANIYVDNFHLSSLYSVSSLILFPLIATGVVGGGKFTTGINNTRGGKFCYRVIDTGDKYATCVVTLAASLLSLSLT